MQSVSGHKNLLSQVREDMQVYDSTGKEIGTVELVYLGGASNEAIEQGGQAAVSPDINLSGDRSLVDHIADVFAPDEMPHELAERLLRDGYIRLDADGLLSADRYIMPEQISSVSDNSVRLRVSFDERAS
jgi:hypothetical protein